jgi:hypothetical protein
MKMAIAELTKSSGRKKLQNYPNPVEGRNYRGHLSPLNCRKRKTCII